MTLSRVFRRSVRFTVRYKRRFLVFLLIFAIVSTLIAFSVDEIDSLRTTELLNQKGVTATKAEGPDISYTNGNALYQDVLNYVDSNAKISLEAHMMFRYIDLDSNIRIHSLDISNPWISNFANPSLVQQGSYPNKQNEILVPLGSAQARNITVNGQTYQLQSLLSVGQQMTFSNAAGKEVSLEVSGTFDTTQYTISNPSDQLWLFMDNAMFNKMLDLFGYTAADTSVYELAFVVSGWILTESTYTQTTILNDQVKTLLADGNYGNFRKITQSLPLKTTLDNSSRILVNLAFVIIGGILLATLFAYLITRFRRREIAILKAMGYSHGAVRMSLFAEILTTSFSGFALGLGLAQALLVIGVIGSPGSISIQSGLNFENTIRLPAIALAFGIMVVIAIPGMLLASFRILRVSPAEAFRDN